MNSGHHLADVEPQTYSGAIKTHLYCEDCVAGIPLRIEAGSVDVVVTSPPYNNGTVYRTYEDSLSPEEYLAWTLKWTSAVQNALRDDGSLFLNLGAPPSVRSCLMRSSAPSSNAEFSPSEHASLDQVHRDSGIGRQRGRRADPAWSLQAHQFEAVSP